MALEIRLRDRIFTLEEDDGTIMLDGAAVDARLERLGGPDEAPAYLLVIDNRPHTLTLQRADGKPGEGTSATVTADNRAQTARVLDETALLLERFGFDTGSDAAAREVRAPMPGLVLQVLVAPGDSVQAGQGLVVLEAMKMENELRAAAAGTVAAVHAEAGAAVGKNDLLVEIE